MTIQTSHPAIRPDDDRPWTTVPELDLFTRMVDSGQLSFFRIGTCEECKADCPKVKSFCSKACFEKHEELEEVKARVHKLLEEEGGKAKARRKALRTEPEITREKWAPAKESQEEPKRSGWDEDYED